MQLLDEEYQLLNNPDGTQSLYIDRNKNGFKIKVNFTNDEERAKQSQEAIENFMITEIAEHLLNNKQTGL